MPFLLLFALALGLVGCESGADPATGGEGGIGVPPGTAAEYERRLLFLTALADAPVAAVFDFRVVTGGAALQRAARGWLVGDDGWTPFLEARWDAEPMRDPWRIVPHGPLRLVIGDADELEALVHRGTGRSIRLEPGVELGAWSPGPGGQFRLQRARLRVDGQESLGALLDVQLGRRRTDAGAGRPDAVPPPEPDGGLAEVFLTDGVDLFLVFSAGSDRTTAGWAIRGVEEMVWDAVEIAGFESSPVPAPTDGNAVGADAPAIPTSWRVRADRGGLAGELRSEAVELSDPPAAGAPPARVLHLVEGWIELGGERRLVFGLVQHVPG